MSMALMFERLSSKSCSFPLRETQSTFGKSYYKFYQLKLRQLLTQHRQHQEQEVKSKQKQLKSPLNDKRFHKEYMHHVREKIKLQSQEYIMNKNDDNGKRASSVLSITNRRTKDAVTFTITTTNISTTNSTAIESRPKSILKTKQPSISKTRQRVISAPANSQKNINKKTPPMKIPTIEIDYADDNLSKSNGHSFTQVTSSSQYNTHQYTRQSILNTIILHVNSHAPSDVSKWNVYRDFDDQFSASLSPDVYRNFERIIL